MNQLKCFFKILDRICLELLAKDVLNIKSIAAYQYFVKCKDNHKAWQSFETFLHGTTMELLRLYDSETTGSLSPLGFLKWQSKITSPTLKLITQLVLTYGLGIYTQRVGDRSNDIKISDVGRFAYLDLFYAFNHPIYREIEYRDLRNRAIYPNEVTEQRNQNLSFSTGSLEKKNQGGDFLLEQKIQRQKMIAPKGIVDKSTWKRISRSIDKFDSLYTKYSNILKVNEKSGSRNIILNEEVIQWRSVLRYSNYLTQYNQHEAAFNIFGENLHDNLLNLSNKAKTKRLFYWEQKRNGKNLQNITYLPLRIIEYEEDLMAELSEDELS
ncbi:uncharacterized protein LOC130649485 [Hydractinia symbiolongicarpus]|uniref:uncharacterized protein LOC130649485 n=1 Tax=Hydractinia symbiolongicarpus TaxID=13093 RepID=UPI00254DFE82|nr:uncharacterized protein LOC130649485 [Hydractinia symbiolongicarpus]